MATTSATVATQRVPSRHGTITTSTTPLEGDGDDVDTAFRELLSSRAGFFIPKQDTDVFEALRAASAALCVAEDEDLATPLVATTGWGYLRLRRQDYGEPEVRAWAEKLRSEPWSEAF